MDLEAAVKSLEHLGAWNDKVGFEEVGTLECTDQCYSFDVFGIIKGPDGRYWYGQTTGCSCPGFWHEYEYDPVTFDTTLSPLNPQTALMFERDANEWDGKVDPDEKRSFIRHGIALAFTAKSSERIP